MVARAAFEQVQRMVEAVPQPKGTCATGRVWREQLVANGTIVPAADAFARAFQAGRWLERSCLRMDSIGHRDAAARVAKEQDRIAKGLPPRDESPRRPRPDAEKADR